MSIADLVLTEVHYNLESRTPPFLEILNTGDEAVTAGDFTIGTPDQINLVYGVIGPNATLAPSIPAGATIILVPSRLTRRANCAFPPNRFRMQSSRPPMGRFQRARSIIIILLSFQMGTGRSLAAYLIQLVATTLVAIPLTFLIRRQQVNLFRFLRLMGPSQLAPRPLVLLMHQRFPQHRQMAMMSVTETTHPTRLTCWAAITLCMVTMAQTI